MTGIACCCFAWAAFAGLQPGGAYGQPAITASGQRANSGLVPTVAAATEESRAKPFRPDGALLGPGAAVPVGSGTGFGIISVNASGATTLGKAAHGINCLQGDIVVITASDSPSNLGLYHVSGSDADSIEISKVLSRPDKHIALTVYRNVVAMGVNGQIEAQTTIPDLPGQDLAYMLSYSINKRSGNSDGLVIRFTGSAFGSSHFPFAIYRGLFNNSNIFQVDAVGTAWSLGDMMSAGSLVAKSGAVRAGNAVIAGIAAPSGVTVTPSTLGGGRTWSYVVVGRLADGTTATSAVASANDGPAALNAGNSVSIAWKWDPETDHVEIYRVASGGVPYSLGKVYTGDKSNSPWIDTGVAGDGTRPPLGNLTGTVQANRIILGSTQMISFSKTIAPDTATPMFSVSLPDIGAIGGSITAPTYVAACGGTNLVGVDSVRWAGNSFNGSQDAGIEGERLTTIGGGNWVRSWTYDTTVRGRVTFLLSLGNTGACAPLYFTVTGTIIVNGASTVTVL